MARTSPTPIRSPDSAKDPAKDPVWGRIRSEAADLAQEEPLLASFLYAAVLNHERFETALSFHLARKLASEEMGSLLLREVMDEAFTASPPIGEDCRTDISAVIDRDPACNGYIEPLLYFKGFHALQSYRVGHWLWRQGRKALAFYLQNRVSTVLGVDIHPAARIGCGIMIDHATGIVIGETAVVEDDVSILQGVTLGGTGKESGDRHPKVRRGALLAAGAKILGNIEIGSCARIGAGSVVLSDVPANSTAVGVPARVINTADCPEAASRMDQVIPDTSDYQI